MHILLIHFKVNSLPMPFILQDWRSITSLRSATMTFRGSSLMSQIHVATKKSAILDFKLIVCNMCTVYKENQSKLKIISSYFLKNVSLMMANVCYKIVKKNHRSYSFIIDFQQVYNTEHYGFLKFFRRNIELGSTNTKLPSAHFVSGEPLNKDITIEFSLWSL